MTKMNKTTRNKLKLNDKIKKRKREKENTGGIKGCRAKLNVH